VKRQERKAVELKSATFSLHCTRCYPQISLENITATCESDMPGSHCSCRQPDHLHPRSALSLHFRLTCPSLRTCPGRLESVSERPKREDYRCDHLADDSREESS
jgi:hypothetical protein